MVAFAANEVSGIYSQDGTEIASRTGLFPQWSPKLNQVAYLGYPVDGPEEYVAEGLWLMDPSRGTVDEIIRTEFFYYTNYYDFSPDGTIIVICGSSLDAYYTPDGFVSTLYADLATSPAWSPDGKTIAFEGMTMSSNQNQMVPLDYTGIYLIDADGNNLRWFTNGFGPLWQPNGEESIGFSVPTTNQKLSESLLTAQLPDPTKDADPTADAGTNNQPTANDIANLRSGTSTDYPVVGKASEGTDLIIVGRNAAGDWCQLASGEWIAAFLIDNVPTDLPEVVTPSLSEPAEEVPAQPAEQEKEQTEENAPPVQPPATSSELVVFDGDPRNSANLCDGGFRSDCGFEGCGGGSRLVWGPFCRARDHSYIQDPGQYRVTVYGSGHVIAGATDTEPTEERYTFGSQEITLPGSYTFCWPGLAPDGFGFETIVEGIDGQARVDRMVIEFMGAKCD